jgi:hypothetical protein
MKDKVHATLLLEPPKYYISTHRTTPNLTVPAQWLSSWYCVGGIRGIDRIDPQPLLKTEVNDEQR